ncbi:MAG: hypothetical protein IJ640_00105 [Prevotella sp.]|nr:hypothetical protein [Prevotella sp.]
MEQTKRDVWIAYTQDTRADHTTTAMCDVRAFDNQESAANYAQDMLESNQEFWRGQGCKATGIYGSLHFRNQAYFFYNEPHRRNRSVCKATVQKIDLYNFWHKDGFAEFMQKGYKNI